MAAAEAYERVLDQCHAAADRLWGKGSTISVDREGSGYVARGWTPQGKLGKIGLMSRTKIIAARALLRGMGA